MQGAGRTPLTLRDNGLVISEPNRVRGRSRLPLVVSVAALVLAVDIVTKCLVVANLGRDPKRLLGGAVYLVQARNSGAAFSLGTGATVVLTAVAIAVTVTIVRMATKLTSLWWAIALGGILGGALGNLVDRFFRAPGPGRGHVVDFVSLFASDGHVWPIFNVADSGIVGGAIVAVVLTMRDVHYDDGRTRDTPAEASTEPIGDDLNG